MGRIRLRTCLIAVAVLAVAMALMAPALRESRLFYASALVKGTNSTVVIQQLTSPACFARVAADPKVAALPEIRGAVDP